MRVMHVIEAMHQGGAESLVVEHVRLAARDVETWVVALNRGGPALEAAAAAGAHVEILERSGLARIRALADRMRAARIEVVNGHNPTGGLSGALAARFARVPAVLRTEHSFHFAGRHSRAYPLLERLSTSMTDRVICVCEAVRASHTPRLGGDPARFVVVKNGVDARTTPRPRAETRAALGIDREPLVLTIGSLTRQKAQRDLIDAFADSALAGARLAIAGEGPLRPELEARIARLGLCERIRLLGARNDAADLLEACDVFVLSSVREGLSVTLLEAMRAGRAAVATAVGGNAEAVEDGVTGRMVPPGDPRSLGGAIAALLSDPEMRARMGRAAHERWRAEFTAERMVRETENLYRAVLGRHLDVERHHARGNAA